MGEITNEMVEKSYELGKDLYLNKITRKKALESLHLIGMNKNSAIDYTYIYSNLIEGKLFKRTANIYSTKYYLKKIYEENGKNGLQNALLSLSQHIDYYEEKSGSSVKQRKEVFNEYLKLLDNQLEPVIYADEVDESIEYSEGKTKKILVNSYERNPIARKKCIDHFGVTCQICEFDFEKIYGEIGKEFIHVHHKIEISTIGSEYLTQ